MADTLFSKKISETAQSRGEWFTEEKRQLADFGKVYLANNDKFADMSVRLYGNKKISMETLIFVGLWLLIFLFPIMEGLVNFEEGSGFFWPPVYRFWLSMLPFLAAFLLHDLFLLPIYMRKQRGTLYAILAVVLISVFSSGQYFKHQKVHYFRHSFHTDRPEPSLHDHPFGAEPGPQKGRLPLPMMMDTFLLILLLGFDLAVVLIIRNKKTEEERKQLENMRMQDELRYLKAQIDPHFFMNMLNNIHSMVDVNPELAQQMILDLSKLMRYVLYEGSNSYTTFENEVQFISKYVELMRQRYPSDKVEISLEVPEAPSASLLLPPLLFISFVENAFKHGVSYMRRSEIFVSLSEEPSRICFKCSNTRPPLEARTDSGGGVGLANVRRRLDLLYQDRYVLDIVDTDEIYSVILIIPGL